MIEVIFFDFDGVIVESVDLKTDAFAKLFEHEDENNLKDMVAYHLKNTGVSRYEKFGYIYEKILKRPLDNKEFQALCNRFADIVFDGVLKVPYVEGVMEFLGKYSLLYKCFVVSATPQKELEEIIQKRGIRNVFKAIYGAPKSKSDAVKEILISKNIKPINSLFIGDALSDYNAAMANCVKFVARINNNESLFDGINCLKIKNLVNLKSIVDSFN
mgnify:FL=1